MGGVNLEVAPEPVVLFFSHPEVELAVRRRILHDGAVVAEGRNNFV